MRNILVILLVLALTQIGLGIDLSGSLSGTLGPGEYHIVDDIIVQAGDNLTLLPGTIFLFDGPYPFDIHGIINAQGTQGNSIEFTCDTLVNPERWHGIRFWYASSSASVMSYCIVEYGVSAPMGEGWGEAGGIVCRESSPKFYDCTIQWNRLNGGIGAGGVCFQSHLDSPPFRSDPLFERCSIAYNEGGGVFGGFASIANFVDCIIADNIGDGVNLDRASAELSGCKIEGNTNYGIRGGSFLGYSEMTDCDVRNNGQWGIWAGMHDIEANNCRILDNGGGVFVGGGGSYFINCIMRSTEDAFWFAQSFPILVNCTLLGSMSGHEHGAELYNCIWYCPECPGPGIGSQDESMPMLIEYCAFFVDMIPGTPDPPGLGVLTTTNANGDSCDQYFNIFLDPQFVDFSGEDYHLSQIAAGQAVQSPCVDAGNPSSSMINGATRSDNIQDDGVVDMGYHYANPSIGYIDLIQSGPPDWTYRLHWISGSLDRFMFTNICSGTIGSVSGSAAATGWIVINYPNSIVFLSTTPLTSGSIATFTLSHPWCSDVVDWTVGDSSGSVDGPLPVEMTTFQAFAGDGQVTLRWQTASEQDNDHFVLYKRRIGQNEFQRLAEIPGHGTTTEIHDYNYADSWVQNDVTYEYQISDVDIIGRETFYEQTISATPGRNAVPTNYALYQNHPNPFNPTTEIVYDISEAGQVTLKVFNLLGQEIATLVDAVQSPQRYHVSFDGSTLASGVYLYTIQANDFYATRKMVLLK